MNTVNDLVDKYVRIRFNQGITLSVIDNVDLEDDTIDDSLEEFNAGDEIDVDVYGANSELNSVDIQFGNGSVSTNLNIDLFTVVKEYEYE